jgi:Arc/MetJ-type ribon-helix-helix transcriptional regulator
MSNTIRKKIKPNHKARVSLEMPKNEFDDLNEMTDRHYFGNMSLAVRESVKYAKVHKFNKKGNE